jgi:magnesium-dependent phosphatase 1
MMDIVDYKEIYKSNKQVHLKNIQKKSGGIPFNEMIFFDDDMTNIRDVSKLGVISIYTPDGVT